MIVRALEYKLSLGWSVVGVTVSFALLGLLWVWAGWHDRREDKRRR